PSLRAGWLVSVLSSGGGGGWFVTAWVGTSADYAVYREVVSLRAEVRKELVRVPGGLPLARLAVETIRVCLRYRVTGLASEAGFFMLLSLPPLLLGLFG